MARQHAAVFVDTAGWLALLSRRDQAHGSAVRIWTRIRAGQRPLVTTDLVAAECHTLLQRRVGSALALEFLESLRTRPHQRVVCADEELLDAAIDSWLRRLGDLPLTLTDAVSFEVMSREGIREAFTFDEDFRVAGFEVLGER